jgi:hypothetical protein
MRAFPISLCVAALAIGTIVLVLSPSREHSTDPGKISPEVGPSVPGPSIERSDRVAVGGAEHAIGWQQMCRIWLFDPSERAAGASLRRAIAEGEVSMDAAVTCVLDLLVVDVGSAPGILCRDAPIADLLLSCQRPSAVAAIRARDYARIRASQHHHRRLQALLAGWPCYDPDSCRESLAVAMVGLEDDALWAFLRERIVRQGSVITRDLVQASLELVAGDDPRVGRVALVLEALLSFGDESAVSVEIRDGMRQLGDAILGAQGGIGGGPAERFGVYGPTMSAFGYALAMCLNGDPRYPDSMSQQRRRALVANLMQSAWPGDPKDANAFHRLMLGLVGRNPDPVNVTYLQRVATHCSQPGARITAITKLGMSQTPESIERLFAEIVASDPSVIRDVPMRIAFYAAIDNARLVDPVHRLQALRLFQDCLMDSSVDSVDCQLHVLQALERQPMAELAWLVEQIAHKAGSPLAAQAMRTWLRVKQ